MGLRKILEDSLIVYENIEDNTGGGHPIASHNDTTTTGAQLDELAGGEETVLHSHAPVGYLGYIKVTDTKAQNTNGGTFTSGAWRTRDLTTEDNDTNNDCSLANNQIILATGTYECRISCPCYEVDSHQARLYNTTGATIVSLGTCAFSAGSGGGGYTDSIIVGRFTIAASQVLEVQHYCNTTRTDYGYGIAFNQTSEVYTIVEFWRVS